MSRLVWFIGWVGVGIWSLVCLLTYGFLDVVGRLVMGNADMMSGDPETVEGIWRLLSWLHSASTGAVVVIWAVVSLLILAVPWILDRLIAPSRSRIIGVPRGQPPYGAGPASYGGGPGVIDLGPDQYSVNQAGPGRPTAGPTPRIRPNP